MRDGGSTTPRIRSGFMLFGCTRRASSNRPRRRSSPTAPTGVLERAQTRAEGMSMHRRHFLSGIAAAAGGTLLRTSLAAADGPPEVTKVTLAKPPALCVAPQFIVEDLLRADGFTDVRYV